MARQYVWQKIVDLQPNYIRTDLPRNIATRIANIESVDPFGLIGHWVAVGVLSCALGDYEMLYDAITSAQDVACQFPKEDIWISGAKYGFGLSILFLMRNKEGNQKTTIQKLHRFCQQWIVSTESSNVGEEAHILSMAFHEMAWMLWECKYEANQLRYSIPDKLLYMTKALVHERFDKSGVSM